VTAGREADQTDAVSPIRATTPNLGAQRAEGHRVRNIERVAENAGRNPQPAKPLDDRLGLVPGMRRVPAARQDYHVRVCQQRSSSTTTDALTQSKPIPGTLVTGNGSFLLRGG
jgi:hypothetical protein